MQRATYSGAKPVMTAVNRGAGLDNFSDVAAEARRLAGRKSAVVAVAAALRFVLSFPLSLPLVSSLSDATSGARLPFALLWATLVLGVLAAAAGAAGALPAALGFLDADRGVRGLLLASKSLSTAVGSFAFFNGVALTLVGVAGLDLVGVASLAGASVGLLWRLLFGVALGGIGSFLGVGTSVAAAAVSGPTGGAADAGCDGCEAETEPCDDDRVLPARAPLRLKPMVRLRLATAGAAAGAGSAADAGSGGGTAAAVAADALSVLGGGGPPNAESLAAVGVMGCPPDGGHPEKQTPRRAVSEPENCNEVLLLEAAHQ